MAVVAVLAVVVVVAVTITTVAVVVVVVVVVVTVAVTVAVAVSVSHALTHTRPIAGTQSRTRACAPAMRVQRRKAESRWPYFSVAWHVKAFML